MHVDLAYHIDLACHYRYYAFYANLVDVYVVFNIHRNLVTHMCCKVQRKIIHVEFSTPSSNDHSRERLLTLLSSLGPLGRNNYFNFGVQF